MTVTGESRTTEVLMILTDTTGRESEIRSLLQETRPELSKTDLDAWMQTVCRGASIFCILENEKIEALLVLKKRHFEMPEGAAEISVISEFLCAPDWNPAGAFEILLEPALDAASRNSLFVLARTRNIPLLEKMGFSVLSTTLQADLPNRLSREASPFFGRPWNHREDLYPLYRQFMQNFEGSVILSKEEFDRELSAWLVGARNCLVFDDDKGLPAAFALMHREDRKLKADVLVYTSMESLKRMLSHFCTLYAESAVCFSRSENLHKVFGLEAEEDGAVMICLTSPRLVSHWLKKEIRQPADMFNPLQLPVWNQLI